MASSIKVLESKIKLSEYDPGPGGPVSRAHLNHTQRVTLTDFSICMRFNYKLLGEIPIETRGRIFTIGDWKEHAKDRKPDYIFIAALHPVSFFGFGRGLTYLVRDPDRTDLETYTSNRWTHFCLSYGKKRGSLRMVINGKLMVVNYGKEELTELTFPRDMLSKIYLGTGMGTGDGVGVPPL